MHHARLIRYTSLVSLTIACAALPSPASAEACIQLYGKSYDPQVVYPAEHQCGTCPGQRATPPLCGTLNGLLLANWDAKSDLLTVPHRGIWGTKLGAGPSENTMNSIREASKQGYKIVELDVALSGTGPDGRRWPFLGHYFTLAAANGPRGTSPDQMPISEIVKYTMNKRDQSSSQDGGDDFVVFEDVLDFAKANSLVIMLDPKDPPGAAKDYLQQVMAYCLNMAKSHDALANLIIKSRFSYSETVNGLKPYLDVDVGQYRGRFLWSVITAASLTDRDQTATLRNMDEWVAASASGRDIAVFETNIFSSRHWSAKTFSYNGNTYDDLTDYVKRLPTPRRSALWSVDPMGNKGTLSRLYTWKFIGNEYDDQRGNPLVTLSYKYARHALITTDIPDTYPGLVEQ